MSNGRTFCIGDIHGGYKALQQCLDRSGFDNESDTLISLGDVADGWSEVPECVELLLSIKNLISIRGNHDAWCMDWMQHGVAQELWLKQGGQATFDAYVNRRPELIHKHQQFFKRQHNFYIDDQNRAFVHGGFTSRKGVGHEPYQTSYYWDRDMWQLAILLHNNLSFGNAKSRRFQKHKEVYIGHSSTGFMKVKPYYPEYLEPRQPKNGGIVIPMNRCNVWNLDTGGGFEGRLTIMDIDTKQFWQSDNVRELYPEEHGRK